MLLLLLMVLLALLLVHVVLKPVTSRRCEATSMYRANRESNCASRMRWALAAQNSRAHKLHRHTTNSKCDVQRRALLVIRRTTGRQEAQNFCTASTPRQ